MSLLSPQLQAFVAIAKHKTVHTAADVIHLTQTAVTQRIKTLEAKLNTTLFIRTRRGMQLTPEGEALLRYCQTAKEIENMTLSSIHGIENQSEIQLCLSGATSIMRSRIIPQCLIALKNFPQLLLHFDVSDREGRHKLLKSAHSDIAIIRKEELAKEMAYKKLVPEKYVLVATKDWKRRTLQDIIKNEPIIDFEPNDQVTYDYLKHYDLFDLVHHKRHFVNRTECVAFMLEAGLGYSTLTKEFAKPYLDNKSLIILNGGKTYDMVPFLAWYHRPKPPPYFSAIINAIR